LPPKVSGGGDIKPERVLIPKPPSITFAPAREEIPDLRGDCGALSRMLKLGSQLPNFSRPIFFEDAL